MERSYIEPKGRDTARGGTLAHRIAVFFGFGQAAITAVFVVTGYEGFGLASMIDSVAMAIFAWAAYRRFLWGAYGLAAYALISVLMKVLSGIQSPWMVPLIIYLVGAISLHRAKRREQLAAGA
jgi:hypothetical protein